MVVTQEIIAPPGQLVKILEQHMAVLGKTGSGKTYAAKGIAERLLRERRRVCIVDPTNAWWGLRSDSTGKKAGFPIIVFGGEHADVALGESHGAAIGEIIATTDTSAVLSTRHMTVGERTRFFTAFAETVLRKNKGPIHLIIDEAHLFAPQGKVSSPESGKMLNAANNLVSLGRGVGFRIIMISQRPAKLHKDSLTQAETLIAMRLIAPQDRGAVEDWIGECADDPEAGKKIVNSLPSLPTGEGWIWSPEVGVLHRLRFPKISTYDSSRAPDGDTASVVLASIDLPAIEKRLELVAKDALENDPKRLHQKILDLEKRLSAKSTSGPTEAPVIKELLKAEHDRGFEKGAHSVKVSLARELKTFDKQVTGLINGCGLRVKEAKSALQAAGEWFDGSEIPSLPSLEGIIDTAIAEAKAEIPKGRYGIVFHQGNKPLPPPAPLARISASNGSGPGSPDLKKPERSVLAVLAQRPEGCSIDRLAILAGYTVNGHFNNVLGGLRSKGLVSPPRETPIRITQEGLNQLGDFEPLPTGEDLQAYWLSKLSTPEATILKVLLAVYPDPLPIEDLAAKSGYTVNGHFNNTIGSLRAKGLMSPPRSPIVAADDFFQ